MDAVVKSESPSSVMLGMLGSQLKAFGPDIRSSSKKVAEVEGSATPWGSERSQSSILESPTAAEGLACCGIKGCRADIEQSIQVLHVSGLLQVPPLTPKL